MLVQGEPQFRQYEFDYLPSDPAERQEYLAWMEASGWHPAFRQDSIVLFWTDEKRAPIHTDAATKLESYAPIARQMSRISLILGGLLIGLLFSGLRGNGRADLCNRTDRFYDDDVVRFRLSGSDTAAETSGVAAEEA